MVDLPTSFKEVVAAKRLVPFVGAGVSSSIRKKDGSPAFPSWNELLLKGAEALRDEGNQEVAANIEQAVQILKTPNAIGLMPTQVADGIRKGLSGFRWAKFLRDCLNPNADDIDWNSLALPKAIWSTANNFVITTNFDKILNWACPRPADVCNLDQENYSELSSSLSGVLDKPTIWHLHGYIDNPSKLILTSEMYNQFYSPTENQQSRAALQTLRSTFASRTMLFVGFSFADEYVSQQLEWLTSAFEGFGGEHFALVREAEQHKAESLLKKLQVRPIVFKDFGEPLLATVREIARLGGPVAPAEPLRVTVNAEPNPQPIPITERWRATHAVRLMDQLGPTYVLDPRYFFMDWNKAFEWLVAEPLGLYRGQHAQEFVSRLVNKDAVDARARQVFLPQNPPLVDMEPLVLQSEKFGLIEFWKIASRIIDEEGNTAAWSIALNIARADKLDQLWAELKSILDERVNWALYSTSYDKVLLNFDEYTQLIKLVCSKLEDAVNCADLGAGTGNGTIELLRQKPERTVAAIEPNEEMLTKLRRKVRAQTPDLGDRVQFIKQGLRNLGEFEDGFFDGAIMINVLYAVDDPAACLKEAARTLRHGGILALSTAHSATDVDRLFRAIRDNFTKKGILAEFRATLEDVRRRHEQMMGKIHRDSKEDIRRYLEDAGFDIEEWLDDQYAGAVVVVKAVKVRDPTLTS